MPDFAVQSTRTRTLFILARKIYLAIATQPRRPCHTSNPQLAWRPGGRTPRGSACNARCTAEQQRRHAMGKSVGPAQAVAPAGNLGRVVRFKLESQGGSLRYLRWVERQGRSPSFAYDLALRRAWRGRCALRLRWDVHLQHRLRLAVRAGGGSSAPVKLSVSSRREYGVVESFVGWC